MECRSFECQAIIETAQRWPQPLLASAEGLDHVQHPLPSASSTRRTIHSSSSAAAHLYDNYLSVGGARIARAEDPRPLIALRERLARLQAERQAKDELLERVEEALLKIDAGEAEPTTGQLQGICRRRLDEAKPEAA